MRASILLWSAASGALLGLFLDATLVAVAFLLCGLFPTLAARLHQRWIVVGLIIFLSLVLTSMTALGYLEGELKTM